jgi:hypothetical protein
MYFFLEWNTFIGGCHMTRDTWLGDTAREDGGLEEADYEPSALNKPLPWLVGMLVRKR